MMKECKRGHMMTEMNTYINPTSKASCCRQCMRMTERKRYVKKPISDTCKNGHFYTEDTPRKKGVGGKMYRQCVHCANSRRRGNTLSPTSAPIREERRIAKLSVVRTPIADFEGNTCTRCPNGGWVKPDIDGDLKCFVCERGVTAILVNPEERGN